jgi:hypothetical protein
MMTPARTAYRRQEGLAILRTSAGLPDLSPAQAACVERDELGWFGGLDVVPSGADVASEDFSISIITTGELLTEWREFLSPPVLGEMWPDFDPEDWAAVHTAAPGTVLARHIRLPVEAYDVLATVADPEPTPFGDLPRAPRRSDGLLVALVNAEHCTRDVVELAVQSALHTYFPDVLAQHSLAWAADWTPEYQRALFHWMRQSEVMRCAATRADFHARQAAADDIWLGLVLPELNRLDETRLLGTSGSLAAPYHVDSDFWQQVGDAWQGIPEGLAPGESLSRRQFLSDAEHYAAIEDVEELTRRLHVLRACTALHPAFDPTTALTWLDTASRAAAD